MLTCRNVDIQSSRRRCWMVENTQETHGGEHASFPLEERMVENMRGTHLSRNTSLLRSLSLSLAKNILNTLAPDQHKHAEQLINLHGKSKQRT